MKRYLYSVQECIYGGLHGVRTDGVIEAENEAGLELILAEMSIDLMDEYIGDDNFVNREDYEDYDEYEDALIAAKNENIDFYYCEVDETKANGMLITQLDEWAANDFEDALICFGISN